MIIKKHTFTKNIKKNHIFQKTSNFFLRQRWLHAYIKGIVPDPTCLLHHKEQKPISSALILKFLSMMLRATLYNARRSINKTSISSVLLVLLDTHSTPFSTSCKTQHNTNIYQTTKLSTTPPVPKRVPTKLSAHKKKWQDPYHWMKTKDNPDFIKYLDQENSYADAFMDDTKDLQHVFYSEMTARYPSCRFTSLPLLSGPWYVCIMSCIQITGTFL